MQFEQFLEFMSGITYFIINDMLHVLGIKF